MFNAVQCKLSHIGNKKIYDYININNISLHIFLSIYNTDTMFSNDNDCSSYQNFYFVNICMEKFFFSISYNLVWLLYVYNLLFWGY